MKAAAHFQICMALLALCACLFSPRAGAQLLLVPVWGSVPVGGWPGVALVGRGRIAGTLVVQAAGAVPVWQMLGRGVVPLSVPEVLCRER